LTKELESVNEGNFVNEFGGIQKTYDGWKLASLDKIGNILKEGPMIGKSCPARSVMLFSSLEMDSQKMRSVFEHPNSPKIGHYVPGTEIPIVSDNSLHADKSRNLILWSWHIAYELVPYLKDIGFRGNIWTPLPQFKLLEVI
jgi:D-mycarose 3-C-methyltransferase